MMTVLTKIASCFRQNIVYYTHHARIEMRNEESGIIKDEEIYESICNGEIVEKYLKDKPYPSFLIFGKTKNKRPLHIVCAYNDSEKIAIIITAYQPDAEKWIDFKRRRKT